jgi:putative drug exporter of the RND superfamily
VITAAAAVMIAVFISFAIGDQRSLQLFGVSMAAAVFLDAFIIRSILLPAVLELAGGLTWRFPNGLGRRLPQLAIELPARSGALIEDPLQPVTVTDFDTR